MKKVLLALILLGASALLATVLLRKCSGDPQNASTGQATSPSREAGSIPGVGADPEESTGIDPASDAETDAILPDASAAEAIRRALADLQRGLTPEEAAEVLRQLRQRLLQGPAQETAAAIVAFLAEGLDVASGLPFRVGVDGVLQSAPSLRTALLDLLPTLDPEAAAGAARDIIAARRSPDEYALALRNLAWNDLDGDMHAELSSAFAQMLRQESWRAEPSDGFHEAFDIAVEIGSAPMLEQLAALVGPQQTNGQPSQQATGRAAFMALDRIAQRNPAALVQAFERDPAFLARAPRQRAALMSRLDPREGDQRALLLRYLQRPDHDAEEIDYFAGLFPNGNYIQGYRLVTSDEPVPDITERQKMDREMLAIMREVAPSIPSPAARQAVSTIVQRLEYFARPAR